jgi:hypothetical protein
MCASSHNKHESYDPSYNLLGFQRVNVLNAMRLSVQTPANAGEAAIPQYAGLSRFDGNQALAGPEPRAAQARIRIPIP